MQVHSAPDVGVDSNQAGSIDLLYVDALFSITDGKMRREMKVIDEYAEIRERQFTERKVSHHSAPQAISFEPEMIIEGIGLPFEIPEPLERDDDNVGGALRNAEAAAHLRDVHAAL
jgi:hypothetical protein